MPAKPPALNATTEAFRRRAVPKGKRRKRNPFRSTLDGIAPARGANLKGGLSVLR